MAVNKNGRGSIFSSYELNVSTDKNLPKIES